MNVLCEIICLSFFVREHQKLAFYIFYIHGSVHRDSVLIRSNKLELCAGVYLLQVYYTCFGRPLGPSSGVQKTVTAASGTGHSNGAMTFLKDLPEDIVTCS